MQLKDFVAPFAGAWIEIPIFDAPKVFLGVAPFAGAWIEIHTCTLYCLSPLRRSLRGSVD